MNYSGLWPRFEAKVLDGFVLWPIYIGATSQIGKYPQLIRWYFASLFLLRLFYTVYLVKRFKGTPGKLLSGLRVVRADGSPLRYRDAMAREAVALAMSAALGVGIVYFVSQIHDVRYELFPQTGRNDQLHYQEQRFVLGTEVLYGVWLCIDLIALLKSRHRRALHDLIAGTVVVMKHGP